MRHSHASSLFDCGHRRRNSNPGPECAICERQKAARARYVARGGKGKRAYTVNRSRWRKCTHERTPENTYTAPNGSETCKTCRNANAKLWRCHHDDPRYATHRRWKQPLVVFKPLPSDIAPDTQGRSYAMFPPKRRTA